LADHEAVGSSVVTFSLAATVWSIFFLKTLS